jgi:hypothetical protein
MTAGVHKAGAKKNLLSHPIIIWYIVGERGVLYLDGYDVPTVRHSSVDLPDRCSGKWGVVKFPKLVTPAATKLLRHHKG